MWARKPPFGTLLKRGDPINRGLVGCWLLGGPSGTLVAPDSSDYRNNGTLTGFGANPYVGGHHNGMALNFDGTDDDVRSTITPLTTAYPSTLCGWVNLTNTTACGVVCVGLLSGAGAGIRELSLLVVSGKAWAVSQIGNAFPHAISTSTIATNTDYFLAAVFASATSRKIYVNGRFEAEETTSNTPTGFTGWRIGQRANAGDDQNLAGRVDNCRIFNRALSDADVWRLYAEPWAGFEEPDLHLRRTSAVAAAVRRLLGLMGVGR